MKAAMAAIAASAVLVAGGCGGEDDGSSAAEKAAIKEDIARLNAAAAKTATDVGPQAPGPYVRVPEGAPPKKLVIRDVEEGTGPAAEIGDVIAVRYVGVTYSGRSYSNSWASQQADLLKLGSPDVERGFGKGMEGMKAGGRRELIVPPPLLFYPGERPQPLPPSNTVVYLVDLLEVKSQPD